MPAISFAVLYVFLTQLYVTLSSHSSHRNSACMLLSPIKPIKPIKPIFIPGRLPIGFKERPASPAFVSWSLCVFVR